MEEIKKELLELKARFQLQEKKIDVLTDLLEKEGIISKREFDEELE